MSKQGCFKIEWVNKPRNYHVTDGHIYLFPDGGNRPGIATSVAKTIETVMSPLCRYDLRLKDLGCEGCSKPWDIDYIRKAFGNEYLTSQIQNSWHGRNRTETDVHA